jgi:hypothetical protein
VNQRKEFIILGWAGLGVLLLTLALGGDGGRVQAQYVYHQFHSITPDISQDNKQTGEQQLWLEIHHEPGAPTATFRFYNDGLLHCSIADVYIQDGHLCSLLYIIDKDDLPPPGDLPGSQGVDFSQGATPGNLPDAQYATPPFVATKRFSMDSDPPVQPWGINEGEWLIAVYSVQEGATVYDIDHEIDTGVLRVGFHVQAFDDGASASFVNNLQGIPEPASVLLLGLGGLALLKKYKKSKD